MSTTDAIAFWDGVYAARPQADMRRPNARLAETVTGLPPGDALDLGCGDGGDALWLARRGGQVTAADISAVAVERLAALARSHGLGRRVITLRQDLRDSFPSGAFDLICAHCLHTPFDLERAAVLHTAAHALRPDGRLLVVDHGSAAPWSWTQDPDAQYPGSRRSCRSGFGGVAGRACRDTPPDSDGTRWAHRRSHRPHPPHPPQRLTGGRPRRREGPHARHSAPQPPP